MNREERRESKHKNQLLCEICNRWTVVSYEKWKDRKDRDKNSLFFCYREPCRKYKAEAIDKEDSRKPSHYKT